MSVLYTCASWEPRFWLNIDGLLDKAHYTSVTCFYYHEFADESEKYRKKLRTKCENLKVELNEVKTYFEDYLFTYSRIDDSSHVPPKTTVAIDITTMPRDMIWLLFTQIFRFTPEIRFFYGLPKSYNKSWLSRDPGDPRLVQLHSGNMANNQNKPGLLIVPGFDPDRTLKIINYFEPQRIIIVFPKSTAFDNQEQNHKKHYPLLQTHEPQFLNCDFYSEDNGCGFLEKWISPLIKDTNLILCSLGPKPSAVALYKIHQKFPETALAYIPSRKFNPEYSRGLSRTMTGVISSNMDKFSTTITKPNIFVSYSHKDTKILDLVKEGLRPIIRKGRLKVWDDSKIQPGAKWREDIEQAMKSAHIALFLVSPSFIASEFINNEELPFLLRQNAQSGVRIFWVLVRDCAYENCPLSEFQSILSPSKALNAMKKPERETAIARLTREISNALYEMQP